MDAIIPERLEVAPMRNGRGFHGYSAWARAKIASRAEVVGGKRIWVDSHPDRDVHTSGEMRSATMPAGLTGVSTRIDAGRPGCSNVPLKPAALRGARFGGNEADTMRQPTPE
ncbi:hypothetical protein GCM10009416_22450 [Craurococcus roseus]|uniref:Uncharacterized protein n=1 Tax=Craurococcus roseus TaxID=77585 RepID=A0ABP3Q5F2_9PROT